MNRLNVPRMELTIRSVGISSTRNPFSAILGPDQGDFRAAQMAHNGLLGADSTQT